MESEDMKLIRTEEAVGSVLCHDLTRIVPGQFKGAQFKKGHVVTAEDIPMLLSMGKDHLYVWEMQPGMLHEDEAAERLGAICRNEHMLAGPISEGKIELYAQRDGLLRIDLDKLNAINMLGEIVIATRHSMSPVKAGDKLAGARVIPLTIEEEKLIQAEELAGGSPIMELLPYKLRRAAVITTGNEVFYGRVEDRFTPVIEKKLMAYGIETAAHTVTDDRPENILAAIEDMRSRDIELLICTGGMSVDPDDNTPGAIKESGTEIVTYGAPVLPGAMLLLGYYGDGMPVMGLPGCVMYAKATVFDLLLPLVASGVRISREYIAAMGNGGLCLSCPECSFPHCPFGR